MFEAQSAKVHAKVHCSTKACYIHTLMDGGCSLFSMRVAISLEDGMAVATKRIMTSTPTRRVMTMSSCQSLRDYNEGGKNS